VTGTGDARAIGVVPAVLAAIADHARRDAPRECCGLLVGTAERIVESVPTANLDPSPSRFRVDPAVHIRLNRTLRGTGRAVVGVYHSHPRGPARPSPRDVEDAAYPDFVYLIVSLAAGEADVRAFMIRQGEVADVIVKAETEEPRS
jgi:proteasome lid subunit RPN8/RPN11